MNIYLKKSIEVLIDLKNVMKVLVYFGVSIAKAGVFIYIFTYHY